MDPTDFINTLYQQLQDASLNNSGKAEILYNIVFVKKDNNQDDIYVDIKLFTRYYILSMDEKKYLYDRINLDKIISIVDLLEIEQKVKIYSYIKKLLIKYHFEEDWEKLKSNYYTAKIKLLEQDEYCYINPFCIIKILYFKSLYSYKHLIIFITIFIFLDYIILLPNKSGLWPTLYSIKYEEVSKSFYLNHLINILYNLFEIDSDFEIKATNTLGGIFIILGKIIKIVFIVKYVIDKLFKKLHLDE